MNWTNITLQRFPGERNDCVVLAAAIIEEKTFYSGRKLKRGTSTKEYCTTNGYKPYPLVNSLGNKMHLSLKDVAAIWTKGRFMVVNRNHAMALIDGVVHNVGEPPWRSEIVELWEWKGKQ